MTESQISGYVNIVFERESSYLKRGTKTWRLVPKSHENLKASIIYDNAQTLIDLFASLNSNDEIECFENAVAEGIWYREESISYLSGTTVAYGTTALAFYTLVRLGRTNRALESTRNPMSRSNCSLLLELILDLLSEDFNYFKIDEFNLLIAACRKINPNGLSAFELKEKVIFLASEVGYKILKEEIRGVNIEINRDKEAVINKIATLGMGDQYEISLNEIDKYLTSSAGVVASGMIGNLRSLWEQLIIELAKKISGITNDPIPKASTSKIGDSRSFIKNKLELSDADHNFMSRFVDILNSEGGHAFTSKVEYFRLCRNIAVEIIYLLLAKTESLKSSYDLKSQHKSKRHG